MSTYALVHDAQISPDMDILQPIVTGDLLSVLHRALELRQQWATSCLEAEHAQRVYHDPSRQESAQRVIDAFVSKYGDPRRWNIAQVASGWKAKCCDVKDRISAEAWAESQKFGDSPLRDWFLRLPLQKDAEVA